MVASSNLAVCLRKLEREPCDDWKQEMRMMERFSPGAPVQDLETKKKAVSLKRKRHDLL